MTPRDSCVTNCPGTWTDSVRARNTQLTLPKRFTFADRWCPPGFAEVTAIGTHSKSAGVFRADRHGKRLATSPPAASCKARANRRHKVHNNIYIYINTDIVARGTLRGPRRERAGKRLGTAKMAGDVCTPIEAACQNGRAALRLFADNGMSPIKMNTAILDLSPFPSRYAAFQRTISHLVTGNPSGHKVIIYDVYCFHSSRLLTSPLPGVARAHRT